MSIRRFVAQFTTILLLALVTLFVPSNGGKAHAQTPQEIDIDAQTSLTITKFEQPQTLGDPADGEQLSKSETASYTPVGGVTFEIIKVPLDSPLNTAAGWQEAATMSVAQAMNKTANTQETEKVTTDGAGHAQTHSLGVGLFLVKETNTPAGVVAADPFLVALPLQTPESNNWNYDVYVYPKNARVNVSLTVNDENTVTVGDSVYWTARADIPRLTKLDAYVLEQEISAGLEIRNHFESFTVSISGSNTFLQHGADYKVSLSQQNPQIYVIDFTATGRKKLEEAKANNPDTQVKIEYETTVIKSGAHKNKTFLTVNNSENAKVSDFAETKYGPLAIEVFEHGKPKQKIAGAKFQLFLNQADAVNRRNPVIVAGMNEWVTDENGFIIISGLRFSNFVNGVTRLPGDPLYRNYWVAMTHVPQGWSGSGEPIKLAVTATDKEHMQIAIVELTKETTQPEHTISATGTKVTGIVIGAVILLGVGLVIIFTRKQKRSENDENT